jgi:hypothetical protein
MSFIPANHYQSSDYTKHSKPGYPKKHRTWLSAFYATIRVPTTYTISLLASCSSFFCSHVNLFLTFSWAKVRNRKKHQYVTAETLTKRLQSRTGRATRILLHISALGIFRVTKYTTLKSAKQLLFSDLQVTQNVGDWNRT